MGVVYLAVDTSLHRRVAIKTLPRVSVAESVRLRREARAMAAFAHPNLALVFGIESWRGSPALVMEFLEGGTLADRLRRGRLTPAETTCIAAELAGAIGLIHEAGLLHRDIKPSNIAFTGAGQTKLLDFGLAQMYVEDPSADLGPTTILIDTPAWTSGSDLTTVERMGAFAGTPAYMAPEARRGQALDGGADLWSLGMVLFECLAGERPVAGSAVEIDAGHEIRTRVPECPAPLSDLVADLLAPDRRKRPKSARVVSGRLRECSTLRVA
jgi:serine/threonine-protein kinase